MITITDKITVKLIRHMASDDSVVQAAQVSVKGENNPETVPERLINYLMEHRHGSPFEHNMFTFFVEAPIFVFREWQRHRISSFNEMSGRYTKLLPKFYSPSKTRRLDNIGTSARPVMAMGTTDQSDLVANSDQLVFNIAWEEYERRLNAGICNEIARTVLPVAVYSQMYWTVNARSLMNFLSLRVSSENSYKISYPQKEIEMGAIQVEQVFAQLMPLTYKAFIRNGRMAP